MGIETSDDAAIYKITDEIAMIQTVDFFTPIVDDPYMFGQIAAANSLSDVWAMGGEPAVALNIVGFPNCLDPAILGDILAGGADKVKEAGAVLVGGQTIVGRIRGIKRPPLAPIIPTETGISLLIDCGANVDARPEHLLQFAKMGSIYMENVVGIKNPRVAIVNIGAEEEKGNALVKETFPLLKECEDINFVGSIEAREIPHGGADVIVCEAFVGNVILKLYEGLSSTLIGVIKAGLMSNLKSKIGAALALPSLKKTLKAFDASQYGGAPLLGLNGLVVKTHGSSKAKEITNSIYQCVTFREENINEIIKERIVDSKNNEEE